MSAFRYNHDMKLNNYYPYLIVIGGVFLLMVYAIWNRYTGDTARELDPEARLIGVCIIAGLMIGGFLVVQMLENGRLNTEKAKVIFQQKTQVCREMPEPSQRTLCMMQVVNH